uniref:Uncharacterized protein n=1 Tax=Arundo donax TaxID=35708 RepID=A0A0A9D1L2_ARUDO
MMPSERSQKESLSCYSTELFRRHYPKSQCWIFSRGNPLGYLTTIDYTR